ncbi:nucleolar protein 6 [Achroia grisella]|uniref:nucleolar protein 6 n=1 Tax=Achroia grisella TaxID=688607 RepID=UPI0027D210CB|nr:nucleolar protein 6 [Achroia grisella]
MVKRKIDSIISEDNDTKNLAENGDKQANEPNKDGKKRIKNLYRQPTVNELNRLQETENLFNSNLFRLQVEEILEEVKVKEKVEKKLQLWLVDLKTHLQSIGEDNKEYDLSEQILEKHLKVKLPISNKLKKTKCMFKFHKFTDIEIVGSYGLKCPINSKLRVDIQITVPAVTYTKNDSINYRYHKKRAAYLAVIASHLKNANIIEELKYSWPNGCETKPVLDFKPAGKLGNFVAVRIDLICEPEAYKLHRFSPSRNNLRETWLLEADNAESNVEVGPPSPYYNSSVLTDLTASENENYLREVLLKSENLKQAVVLLKIWLRQRKLQVSGHIVSMIVAYLVQTKRINNIMSSYQIIRNVWIALRTSEWDTKGISLHKGDNTPQLEEFLQHFPVVFLDKTGCYNVCWQMCKGTYDALKRECAISVEMLDNGKINSFIPIFMTPIRPLLQFDHILRFKNFSNIKQSVIATVPTQSRVNYGLDERTLVIDTLHALLTKGLGNRVNVILQLVDADLSWPVKIKPEKAKKDNAESISFGIILNPDTCFNAVEKGPPANLPEAEEFRAFWGDKSELRRFQDGSITETCVWEADSNIEQRGITRQIIDYLLKLKYRISSVFSYSEPMPPLALRPQNKPWQKGNCCLIKNSERATSMPQYTPVSKVIIELGHSGKWPGDIEAFRCLKAAFHLQIAERLNKQFEIPTQAYPTHFDVLKDGLVFRLAIAHPKEITLIRRQTDNGVVKFVESEESIELHYDTVVLPRLRGALHGLHQKQPSFGPAACLLRRWFCSQLLGSAMPEVTAELVVAAASMRPSPLPPTISPVALFARALTLLVETDWSQEVVTLDFNDDFTAEEISTLERQFSSREDKTPRMYIVTPYDGELPSAWSRHSPTPQVLVRVQTLAKSALQYLSSSLLEDMKENILPVFVPSLSGYDVIIHLEAALVPYYGERLDQTPRQRAPPASVIDDVIPVVEFHPVMRYLEELRSAYNEYAMFFHDAYGGDVIAVLWKPDVAETRDLQILNANALRPVVVDGETKYKINTQAIIEDFKHIGQGLVTHVTVNT